MAIKTVAQRNSLAAKYAADVTHAALFTSDPGGTGSVAGEVVGGTYARQPISWSAPSNGVITASVTFDVPAGVTITHGGGCSAATGATLRDVDDLDAPQQFNTAGQYTLALSYTQL